MCFGKKSSPSRQAGSEPGLPGSRPLRSPAPPGNRSLQTAGVFQSRSVPEANTVPQSITAHGSESPSPGVSSPANLDASPNPTNGMTESGASGTETTVSSSLPSPSAAPNVTGRPLINRIPVPSANTTSISRSSSSSSTPAPRPAPQPIPNSTSSSRSSSTTIQFQDPLPVPDRAAPLRPYGLTNGTSHLPRAYRTMPNYDTREPERRPVRNDSDDSSSLESRSDYERPDGVLTNGDYRGVADVNGVNGTAGGNDRNGTTSGGGARSGIQSWIGSLR